jgi:tRNA A-37 threonylcarbamoyl transferase component Bud32
MVTSGTSGDGPQLGDTVLGNFRLLRQIGAGSFATAYLAEQLGTDRFAVVKLPHRHLLHGRRGAELRRRFDAEAKAATRVDHPNLATVYLVGETAYGVPAIAMEYVVGEDLDVYLTHAAPLADAELAELGRQLADVLASLHAADIVHRDLAPGNVIVTRRRDGGLGVKLLDFGVAKLLDRPSRTFGPMGTPGYLAPEQLLGSATPRADVFSLGAVLWWAITGRERADDYSDGSLRASLGRRFGPDPRLARPDAPAAFAELISRALIPDPQLRPSMAEFLDGWREASALDSALDSTPARARVTSRHLTTARLCGGPRVAVVLPNAVMRAQVSSFLQDIAGVEIDHLSARELGRASPGAHDIAVVDEALPVIGTERFVRHLRECYPELTVIVVGFDDDRRARWSAAGADAFIRIPDDLAELGPRLELAAETLSDDAIVVIDSEPEREPKLRRSLIEAMLATAPQQLGASLEAFIGCAPQWLAQIERDVDEPTPLASRRACHELIVGAEAVGARGLARLARATCESLVADDRGATRSLLAACEREYVEVFREVFSLMSRIDQPGAR